MANQQQVERIKRGIGAWNIWRMENRHVAKLDLSNADLAKNDLSNTNLSYMDGGVTDWGMAGLFGIDLSCADLTGANLSGANLTGANLSGANLRGANLRGANLEAARMTSANLTRANLDGTKLMYVDFSYSDLTDADLADANLFAANFNATTLNNANFEKVYLLGSIFADLDLSTVRGLDKINDSQDGPWTIGIDTLIRSNGNIPSTFLKSAGVSNSLIEYATSLIGNAIEYYTCFISYSSKDEIFARRLHADMQYKSVRCWFAPHNMKIGDKIRHHIDKAIHLQDKLLLILSEHSVTSDWVEHEVETALAKERRDKRTILFPIRLDNAILEHSHTGWPTLVQNERHIGDFTGWKDHDRYQAAFDRLIRDLKKADEERV